MSWARAVWLEGEQEEEFTIPYTWVSKDDNVVFWPPSCLNAQKALNSMKEPTNTWRKFPLVKIKGTSDDRKVCEEIENTTTAEVTDDEVNDLPAKRLRKPRVFVDCLPGDESDVPQSSVDTVMELNLTKPKLPPVPKKFSASEKNTSSTPHDYGSNMSPQRSPERDIQMLGHNSTESQRRSRSRSPPSKRSTLTTSPTDSEKKIRHEEYSRSVFNTDDSTSSHSSPSDHANEQAKVRHQLSQSRSPPSIKPTSTRSSSDRETRIEYSRPVVNAARSTSSHSSPSDYARQQAKVCRQISRSRSPPSKRSTPRSSSERETRHEYSRSVVHGGHSTSSHSSPTDHAKKQAKMCRQISRSRSPPSKRSTPTRSSSDRETRHEYSRSDVHTARSTSSHSSPTDHAKKQAKVCRQLSRSRSPPSERSTPRSASDRDTRHEYSRSVVHRGHSTSSHSSPTDHAKKQAKMCRQISRSRSPPSKTSTPRSSSDRETRIECSRSVFQTACSTSSHSSPTDHAKKKAKVCRQLSRSRSPPSKRSTPRRSSSDRETRHEYSRSDVHTARSTSSHSSPTDNARQQTKVCRQLSRSRSPPSERSTPRSASDRDTRHEYSRFVVHRGHSTSSHSSPTDHAKKQAKVCRQLSRSRSPPSKRSTPRSSSDREIRHEYSRSVVHTARSTSSHSSPTDNARQQAKVCSQISRSRSPPSKRSTPRRSSSDRETRHEYSRSAYERMCQAIRSGHEKSDTSSRTSIAERQTITPAVQNSVVPEGESRRDPRNFQKDFPLTEEKFQRKVLYLLHEIRDDFKYNKDGPRAELPELNPCNNLLDFRSFEAQLEDKEFEESVFKFLRQVGGSSVKESVRRVMRRVLGNGAMAQMSMEGKRGKLAFINTKTCKVVKEAVQYGRKETEFEILHSIKSFLKNAPDREGGGGRPTRYQTFVIQETDN